ncbi:MAG: restriction endonuclease subunit S [Pseudomonadota bacterium]
MELRPGYRRTEVGAIPENWDVGALGGIARIKTGPFGTLLKAHEYSSGDGVPLISVGEVGEGQLRVDADTPRVPASVLRRLPEYILQAGDIVVGRKGAVDRSALVGAQQSGWFLGSDGIRIRPLNGCHPPFVAWQLQRGDVRSWLLQNATGTTMPSMNQEILSRVVLPLPPLVEQRAIATALLDVDALITKIDQLITKKRDLKQGAMQQLLTGKTRLQGFKGEWETKRLGAICQIRMGRTPSRLNQAYWGPGHTWLSISDLQEKVVSASKEQITELGAQGMEVVPAGTLLMSFKLSIGRLAFAGCCLYTNEAICSFNDIQASADYLYYALARTDFSLYGKQAVKGHTLNTQSLKEIEVRLPERPEQDAISSILSDMDTELAALENRRDKTRALKQGMMQELLTGRIRLLPKSGCPA